MEYGDPEGSLFSRSYKIDLDIINRMFNQENRAISFLFFITILLIFPAVVLMMHKVEDKFHKNGIDMRSDEMMAGALFDFIDRNQRKNIK